MKIAMIGFGQMGQAIKKIALERGHQIVTIDPQHPQADFKEIDSKSLAGVAVGIDFTTPAAAIGNIKKFADLKVSLVMGTTGWYEKESEVRELIAQSGIGFLYASNFSLGVNVFFRIAELSAQVINNFPIFDVAGWEAHHNKKADSPSGTAWTIANILKDNIDRKKKINFDKIDRKIEADELHFASVRIGSVPGTHEIIYDSPAETITLNISSRNREGFALGAVIGAEWLGEQKGFFKFDEVFKELLK